MPQHTDKWSMFPEQDSNVAQLLRDADLHFTFHKADQNNCEKEYDTNVIASFSCDNPLCDARGWSSHIVPITIRMYNKRRYNARVYYQRCKKCNQLAKPKLDETYAERVAYRLKKWSGISVARPPYNGEDANRPPHISRLCEGCKAGHCRRGSGSGGYWED
jgi:Zinc-binding domain